MTIAPGEAAYARMGVAPQCFGNGHPLNPATLRVVLPGGGTESVAAGDFAFCSNNNPSITEFKN